MTLLTASRLFGDSGIPLRVRDAVAHAPSGAVTAESVKVMFTVSGWAKVATAESDIDVQTGSVVTIPPGAECFGFPDGHARTITFYIHPDYLAGQIPWLSATHPLIHLLHRTLAGDARLGHLQLPPAAMLELTPRLARLAQLPSTGGYEFAALSIASEIVHAVGRVAGCTRGNSAGGGMQLTAPQREITAAIRLLRSDLQRAWRVEDLAQEVALSGSQLGRLFRSQTGLTPAAFIAKARTERMAELLATTRLSISEAAREVGWQNSTVAARTFKRRYGVSPRSFAAMSRHPTTDDHAIA